ncbi:MAG: DUF4832 domain-containing protein [Fimbriimonas sp.]
MLVTLLLASVALSPWTSDQTLAYAPGPIDNPLKGLVPYAGEHRSKFPHSMEFGYLPLSDLMKGRGLYDWTKLERLLDDIASRGHQTVFRIYVEYPASPSGLPQFLKQEGVKVFEYASEDPNVKIPNYTPDYRDTKLQSALTEFITALGKRYDNDPRIGYVTAGLLGYWGEWHTYPRTDLAPPLELQTKVLDAFEKAFRKVPILLRYPSSGDANYVANQNRPFGYHDDSFAWATLDTGKPDDSWFFLPSMKRAKATEKWKQFPIGGEIRPEAWGKVFDPNPGDPQIQNFRKCVDESHATWLMDSGMFGAPQSPERIKRAKTEVARMGYEFAVTNVKRSRKLLTITVENRGVAPFYRDWPVELAVVTKGNIGDRRKTGWKLSGILPGESATWRLPSPPEGKLLIRVPNPMPKGHPVKFANKDQDRDVVGWLSLSQ